MSCTKSRCTWKWDDVSEEMAYKLVTLHLQTEHETTLDKKNSGGSGAKVEKVRRPEATPEMSADKWAYFLNRWETYKTGCGLARKDLLAKLVKWSACLSW